MLNAMHAESLQHWVNQRMIRGRYIFTKEDVLAHELPITNDSLKVSLYRLIKKGMVISPWQNFYVIVPTEYRLNGDVPPSFYIDRLMKYLGREYYVSHLSAAALNGAGHQRAMVFQVTVNGKSMHPGVKNSHRFDITTRNPLPMKYVRQIKTQMGFMNVSSPELTALDLVCNEEKIGGLSRVAELLIELAESMHFNNRQTDLLECFNTSVIQRMGYLLDLIEEHELADALLLLTKKRNMSFRKIRLKQSKPQTKEMEIDNKWKVVINQKIEIDNI